MSTFTDLLDEVYALTNRPDLVAETKTAVKAATLKAHQSDYYYKDIQEIGVSFSTEEYIQSLEYKMIVPRYRALKYLRKTDANGTDTLGFFSILTPEELLDSYGVNKEDVAYVAGQVIQLRSSTKFQYVFLGCYTNPDIVEASYDSWIAVEHPYAIIFDATATVFKAIGYDEQAVQYRQMVNEQLALVKMTNVQAEGY